MTLVLVGLLMIALLVSAAFAVDVGTVYNSRRQAQAAVDAGALAGGLSMADPAAGAPVDRRVALTTWVKYLTYQDISFGFTDNTDITPAEWNAAWQTCVATGAYPSEYTQTAPATTVSSDPVWPAGGATSCIRFSDSRQRLWVRVPDLAVQTAFARVVGIEELDVSAEAEIELGFETPAGVLPFGVPIASAGNSAVCLAFSTSIPNGDGCNGGTTGNWGLLDFSVYGNLQNGATAQVSCAPSNKNNRMAFNTAWGVDHPLSVYGGTVRNDQTLCSSQTNGRPDWFSLPNEVSTGTGSINNGDFEDGMLQGITARYGLPAADGRLERGGTTVVVNSNQNQRIDNTPLWTYLEDWSVLQTRGAPATCNKSGISTKAAMNTCLSAWVTQYANTGSAPVLFRENLGDAVRFGWVPVIEDPTNPCVAVTGGCQSGTGTFPNGNKDVRIKAVRAVWLQTSYFKCSNAGGGRCATIHNPGQSNAGSGNCSDVNTTCGLPGTGNNDAMEAVSAFLLRDGMLPQSVRDTGIGRAQELRVELIG
ncbi:MAG: pilus assembly protein TadG-related protein [Acidimicrobiales bacterium]|nr:pilus assembly protein TadG-related protein [Acidimicrobiales bacterium]